MSGRGSRWRECTLCMCTSRMCTSRMCLIDLAKRLLYVTNCMFYLQMRASLTER